MRDRRICTRMATDRKTDMRQTGVSRFDQNNVQETERQTRETSRRAIHPRQERETIQQGGTNELDGRSRPQRSKDQHIPKGGKFVRFGCQSSSASFSYCHSHFRAQHPQAQLRFPLAVHHQPRPRLLLPLHYLHPHCAPQQQYSRLLTAANHHLEDLIAVGLHTDLCHGRCASLRSRVCS